MSFSIPQFHEHYTEDEKREAARLAAMSLKFEHWIEPSYITPYLIDDISAMEEYLYFIGKDDLIPYLGYLRSGIGEVVDWAIKYDWNYLKDNWDLTRQLVERYIDDTYNTKLAKFVNTNIDISEQDVLKNLRGDGRHQLASNIIDKYRDPETNNLYHELAPIYGDEDVMGELIIEGEEIGKVIANRPEVYRHYRDIVAGTISPNDLIILVEHGYPEIAQSLILMPNDEMFERCLTRPWGQIEMVNILLKKDHTPRIIELDNVKYIQLETVERLFNKGYEVNVDGVSIVEHNPLIAKFMIENYKNVDITERIKERLEAVAIFPPIDKIIEALEVVKLIM